MVLPTKILLRETKSVEVTSHRWNERSTITSAKVSLKSFFKDEGSREITHNVEPPRNLMLLHDELVTWELCRDFDTDSCNVDRLERQQFNCHPAPDRFLEIIVLMLLESRVI